MAQQKYIQEGDEHKVYLRKLTSKATDGELAPAIIQRAQAGISDAQITVIANCIPIIAGKIKKYTTPETRQMYGEDMFSAGVVGILTALDRFDPLRGKMTFGVYATDFVTREIVNFLCEIDGVCKISRRTLLTMREYYARTAAGKTGSGGATSRNGIKMDAKTAAYLSQLMTRTSLDSLICSENANFSDEIENI